MNKKLVMKIEFLSLIILIIPSGCITGGVTTNTTEAQAENTRSDEWILDLQQNGFNNSQWYYVHLNDEDRKKIRLALDYMIDRDHIINDVQQGLGLETFSFIPPTTKYFLDNGTTQRSFDRDKAKLLLTEVFGYIYDSEINDPSTPYNESFPYFIMTIMLPTNNGYRVQWGTDIVNNWKSIGIEVIIDEIRIKSFDFGNWLNNPTDFNHEGLDAAFLGIPDSGLGFKSPGLQITIEDYWFNYLNNITELKNIYNTILYEQNVNLRDQAIQNYQQWIYENVPVSYIYWENVLNLRNKEINGINDYVRRNYENWTYTGHQNVTVLCHYASQFSWLNPALYYTLYLAYPDGLSVIDALYRGLFYTSTENNLKPENPETYPYFADWYNKSADGLTWFVNMKQGLKWHDGVELNASDVKFTFDIQKFDNVTEALSPTQYQFITSTNIALRTWNFGNLGVEVLNSTLLKFTLEKPYSFFKEDILTMKIIPKHILVNISFDDLVNHYSNTGINGAVVGNGPYIFVERNPDTGSLTLQKWLNWDTSYNSLIANNNMNQLVPGSSVPTLEYINFIANEYEINALEMLENGTADITFSYYRPYNLLNLIDQVKDPISAVQEQGVNPQVIYYNQFSPIWGLVPAEPCKQYSDISCVLSDPPSITTISTTITTGRSSTDTISVDFFTFVSSFMILSIVLMYSRKKK